MSSTMSDLKTIKLLLIGNSSTGKSSLLLRYTDDTYAADDTQATIGVDFKIKLLDFRGTKVKLMIWDTAGQERFRTLTSSYYRGCHGVLIVFDVSSRPSFENVPHWFHELQSHCPPSTVSSFLIGNKIDSKRVVSYEEGVEMAKRCGADGYRESSAKENTNVRGLFIELTDLVLKRIKETPVPTTVVDMKQQDGWSSCSC